MRSFSQALGLGKQVGTPTSRLSLLLQMLPCLWWHSWRGQLAVPSRLSPLPGGKQCFPGKRQQREASQTAPWWQPGLSAVTKARPPLSPSLLFSPIPRPAPPWEPPFCPLIPFLLLLASPARMSPTGVMAQHLSKCLVPSQKVESLARNGYS